MVYSQTSASVTCDMFKVAQAIDLRLAGPTTIPSPQRSVSMQATAFGLPSGSDRL